MWWLALVVVLGLAAIQWRAPALLYYGARSLVLPDEGRRGLAALNDHVVEKQAIPVLGIDRNLSGLTFSHHTGTLFGITNRPQALVEIDTEGRLLRSIPLSGLRDPEGISHIRDDWFVIGDEADSRLYWIRVSPGDQPIDVSAAISVQLPVEPLRNLGFEGLSWDSVHQRLVIVQEKWPQRIWSVTGLGEIPEGRVTRIGAEPWRRPWLDVVTSDLSSVTVRESTGEWFLLSAASGVVAQYTESGDLVDMFPLWRGRRGLRDSIPQAEGVAFDAEGRLYIVSEPNLFYRFGPVTSPR